MLIGRRRRKRHQRDLGACCSQARFYVGVGGNSTQTSTLPTPNISEYRCKNERSKIRQNAFQAGALPRPPLGELITMLPKLPSGLRKGHPSSLPTPLDAFGVSIVPHSVLASAWVGIAPKCPQIFSSRTAPAVPAKFF